jgi:hypothetical protein
MLHDASRDRRRGPARMGNPLLRLDFADLGRLHESDGGVAHPEKAVKSLLHAVHPVECDQFHSDRLAVELDLSLDVFGADRDVVNSVGQAHIDAS